MVGGRQSTFRLLSFVELFVTFIGSDSKITLGRYESESRAPGTRLTSPVLLRCPRRARGGRVSRRIAESRSNKEERC